MHGAPWIGVLALFACGCGESIATVYVCPPGSTLDGDVCIEPRDAASAPDAGMGAIADASDAPGDATTDSRSDTSGAIDPGPYPIFECQVLNNLLILDGDPDDPIHPGKELLFQPDWQSQSYSGAFNGIDLEIASEKSRWRVTLWAGHGLMASGLYADAGAPYDEDAGRGLSVLNGQDDRCDVTTGSFYVRDVTWSGNLLSTVTASFEQHCDHADAGLRGCVHFVGRY